MAAVGCGLALVLVAALLRLEPLWTGALVAGGVTITAALFGAAVGVSLLVAAALVLALVAPHVGYPLGAITALGLIPLLLPAVLGGLALRLRMADSERRAGKQASRTRLLTEAAMAMQTVDDPQTLYATIPRLLNEVLDFTHAQVFVPRADGLELVASHRSEQPAGFRLPAASVVGEANETRSPVYVPDVRKHARYVRAPNSPRALTDLAIPLLVEDRVAAVMNIEHEALDAFGEDELRTLLAFAKMAEETLERAGLHARLVQMLDAIRSLAQTGEPQELFRETVRSAVGLIPGAEAGSLMLWDDGRYRHVAALGYDEEALAGMSAVGKDALLHWYGGSEEDFLRGTPRLLTGPALERSSMAGLDSDEQRRTMRRAGRVSELQANICVPISHRGRVTGVLNVDSMSSAAAFGPQALLLAEAFAQQIAVIIRQSLYREALEQAVVRDPLTGLGNREGFNRQLNVELARATRHGHGFNLVMIDLDGFKRINDELGHHEGDRALTLVAEAMAGERREGDSIFRWGGDEFALILPYIDRQQAWQAAERYAAAIARVEVQGYRLAASFGIASYPADGVEAEELLRQADGLMYRHKST